MSTFKQVRKYGAKIAVAGATIGAVSSASAVTTIDTIFGAIDLTTVAASVVVLALLIIGVSMSFKGIDLAKRAIRKV